MKITKITLLMYGLILIIGQAYAAEVVVIPSTQIITPGTNFNMNVSIDPRGTAIAGAQLNIAFNSSLIRVNNITEGNLFTQGGADTFFNDGTINNSAGTVINTFNTIIRRYNVTTQGNFIIINATVIGTSGTSGINLSNVKISDPNGNPVAFNVTNGSIRLNSAPTFTANPTNGSIYNESDTIQIRVTANDPDNDILSHSIKLDGVQVSTSSTYNWTTNFSNSGYHTINITVGDGIANSNSTFTIYINNVYPRYDVNENGVVDIGDLTLIGQHFNEIVSVPYPRYDVNSDGVVDVLDITLTAQYFGEYT